ncbi:MAG: heme biosynthesis HemY N-terminal domain-containing protein [Gammaproteobacteria bacterium]
MRLGAWVLAGIFLGAFGAHFLIGDKGYVLINFSDYVVEMSVPVMVLLLAAGYVLLRLAVRLWRIPKQVGAAVGERRAERVGDRLSKALIEIAQGNWAKGERLLAAGLKGSKAPMINYVLAARAAQSQGAAERRDEWLGLAYEQLPDAETAILLTQAELQLGAGQHELALANLRKVSQRSPDHPLGLTLLAKVYRALEDWPELEKLLPVLARTQLQESEREAIAVETFTALAGRRDLTLEQLETLVARLPAGLRKQPGVITHQAATLSRLGHGDSAEELLRKSLKRDWNAALVLAYGRIKGSNSEKQLGRAEAWLKQHPEDASLLLTAARLCMRVELWGKARSYLETSLAEDPVPEAYELYGRLLTRLGEGDNAAMAYRSGLALATHSEGPILVLEPPRAVDEAG